MINDGVITVTDHSILENWYSTLSNSGRIKIDTGGVFINQKQFNNAGIISSDGLLSNGYSATISNTGSIYSTGTLRNNGLINNSVVDQ